MSGPRVWHTYVRFMTEAREQRLVDHRCFNPLTTPEEVVVYESHQQVHWNRTQAVVRLQLELHQQGLEIEQRAMEQRAMEQEDLRFHETQKLKQSMIDHDAAYCLGLRAKLVQHKNQQQMSLEDDNLRFEDFHMDLMCSLSFDMDVDLDIVGVGGLTLDASKMLCPHSDMDFGTLVTDPISRIGMQSRRAELEQERWWRENTSMADEDDYFRFELREEFSMFLEDDNLRFEPRGDSSMALEDSDSE
jgi:hypothetical protein